MALEFWVVKLLGYRLAINDVDYLKSLILGKQRGNSETNAIGATNY